MNKAVPWNVNGVGFEAREAAREAARRQGKSLGEWLHGVIAERADDIGIDADDMGSRQRVEAVTSRLERLGARSGDHDRRPRAGRVEDLAARRRERARPPSDERDGDDDRYEREHDRHGGRRGGRAVEATDTVLEDAIDAMERRARRAERRTDEAMQSVAELLERNESRRDRERDSVTAFAQKLSDIETRLKEGLAPADDNPIKGALARLEARLDRIGRRGAAEGAIAQNAAPGERPANDSLQRLEDKLNTILDAVHGRPSEPVAEVSSIAMTAARAARGGDRRLGEAIADIAKRQQALDGTVPRAAPRREAIPFRKDMWEAERFVAPVAAPSPVAAIQDEIAALAAKIENLPRDLADQQQKTRPSVDFDGVRAEIASMSDMLRDLAPRGRVADLEETVRGLVARAEHVAPRAPYAEPSAIDRLQDQMREIRDLVAGTIATPPAVERIEQRIAALDERLAAPVEQRLAEPTYFGALAEPASMSPDVSVLEDLVRDLNRKMEAARAPEANPQAFDALQDQIAALASRFEGSDSSITRMAALETSMRDLFAHLEATRASVETSAARSAREVLRIAIEEGRTQTEQGAATSLATIQVLQDEADARTKSTLTAVHDTLERVVDRLAAMETEMAAVRAGKPAARSAEPVLPKAARPADDGRSPKRPASLASADSFLDQVLGQRAADPGRPAVGAADRDPDGARADFIAAARRAAKAAQSDPSVIDFTQTAAERAANPVRASLVVQSRDYVARHKRPVLLGMAAIFVILGTMAIMQKIGLGGGETQMADAAPPAVARTITAAQQPRPVRQTAELSPTALPKSAPAVAAAIPGSDPIQTGSIPSLPSFAAQGAAQMAARPAIPAKLQSMAKAGDGAAEYTLATQYAEGRTVPRDFKQAANLYQKAADQGIVPAQYRLASLYEKGLGVTQDKLKAKSLYIRAAEAGNPRAMHNLAVLLADGDGKPDYEGAATWFRKAAQYGVHDSQFNLAILLARGLGTQQSFVQSYQWFAVAAALDDADAAKKRDEVATKLNAADLAVAKALAASFKPRIADVAATDVQPPPGGWDGASSPSPVNSAKSKISSL